MQKKTEDVAACVYLEVIYVFAIPARFSHDSEHQEKKEKKQVYPESWLLQLLQVLNISH